MKLTVDRKQLTLALRESRPVGYKGSGFDTLRLSAKGGRLAVESGDWNYWLRVAVPCEGTKGRAWAVVERQLFLDLVFAVDAQELEIRFSEKWLLLSAPGWSGKLKVLSDGLPMYDAPKGARAQIEQWDKKALIAVRRAITATDPILYRGRLWGVSHARLASAPLPFPSKRAWSIGPSLAAWLARTRLKPTGARLWDNTAWIEGEDWWLATHISPAPLRSVRLIDGVTGPQAPTMEASTKVLRRAVKTATFQKPHALYLANGGGWLWLWSESAEVAEVKTAIEAEGTLLETAISPRFLKQALASIKGPTVALGRIKDRLLVGEPGEEPQIIAAMEKPDEQ